MSVAALPQPRIVPRPSAPAPGAVPVTPAIAKSAPPPVSSAQLPLLLRRFTVNEYHQLIAIGLLTEDDAVELLEGWIIDKMPREPIHDVAVKLADHAVESKLPPGWHVRDQSAINTDESQPEPDVAVVSGEVRAYVASHPRPRDIALVIEVALSSLSRDRAIKGPLYARAGISVYWIVNLNDRTIEVYTDPSGPVALPSYRKRQDYSIDQTVSLVLPGQPPMSIEVKDLLP